MAEGNDMQAHEASYGRMIGMLKWSAAGVVIVTAFVIWAIA